MLRTNCNLHRAFIRARKPVRFASTSAQIVEEEYTPDAYGLEYGAGPSRIPYNHFTPSTPPNPPVPQRDTSSARPAKRPVRRDARDLMKTLNSLKPGSYATLVGFTFAIPLSAVDPTASPGMKLGDDMSSLSRFQLHIIIHHLIKRKRWLLVTSLLSASISTQSIHRQTISAHISLLHEQTGRTKRSDGSPNKTNNPSRQSPTLNILLDYLQALQKIRHPRPALLYDIVIERCLLEELPDVAAKVFVSLVEEWITEGRLAESRDASIEDFYHGGPPKAQSRPALAKWFKGVRTWCLPGETISPHDRLDLWHPSVFKDKLRNFPLPVPTSPPSGVPAPSTRLLKTILASLKVDESTPRPLFEASVRAAAILANTVLSRTLPMGALPNLLTTFRSIPSHPPVYPESLSVIPEDDSQAYTAYTQVHCALLSLLFSPPSYTYSTAMKVYESNHPSTPFYKPPGERYVFPPLTWKSANLLLQYGLRGVKRPELITSLVAYCKDMFGMGGDDPRAWNIAYRGNTLARDKISADHAEKALFSGQTKLDQSSIINLLSHLTATSQFERIQTIVYRLIPFLDSNDPEPVKRAEPLSPLIYGALLNALEKAGKTNIAQRVYALAIQAESRWYREHKTTQIENNTNSPIPITYKLQIPFYTSMLRIYAYELSSPEGQELERSLQLKSLADQVYLRGFDRWDELIKLEKKGVSRISQDEVKAFTPDERFFNAYIDVNEGDWVDRCPIRNNKARQRLKMVLTDIDNLGLTSPPALVAAYNRRSIPVLGKEDWYKSNVRFEVERTKGLGSKSVNARLARQHVLGLRAESDDGSGHDGIGK